jgi:hypothetical protein
MNSPLISFWPICLGVYRFELTITAFHFPFLIASRCPDAYCDKNNILRGAKTQGITQTYEGSYKDASQQEQNQRRWFGVDNRYIF